MTLVTDILVVDRADIRALAESGEAGDGWEGYTYENFNNVKLCKLLSLLRTGDAQQDFERYMALVEPLPRAAKGSPMYLVDGDQVAELAAVDAMEDDELGPLVTAWHNAKEFEDWEKPDVTSLLLMIGELAEIASVEDKLLLLWQHS